MFEDAQKIEVIETYFKDIFTSLRASATKVVNKAIKSCITTDINQKLTELPSPLEVKEDVFAIHPGKSLGA